MVLLLPWWGKVPSEARRMRGKQKSRPHPALARHPLPRGEGKEVFPLLGKRGIKRCPDRITADEDIPKSHIIPLFRKFFPQYPSDFYNMTPHGKCGLKCRIRISGLRVP